MQLAVCLLVLLLLGIEFVVFGVAACRLSHLNPRGYETGILGFFVYFGMFQVAALPLILLQRPFHELVFLWLIIAAAVNIYALWRGRKELVSLLYKTFAGLWRNRGLLLAAVILLVLFCCCFAALQQYLGWDTSYYVGTVDITVRTDSMYAYDGASGAPVKSLNLRYAISTFYMHSALLCKLTGISGMVLHKYVIGILCILMHGGILFAIGRQLFPDEEKKALFLTGLVFVLHLGFHTNYTVSDFLLVRGYEAKGFCANVVIPAVFYAMLCLWKDRQKREYWFLAFVVCFSSVPVSMSALVIVPAMVTIAVLAEWLTKPGWAILWRAFVCVLPNAVYMILYFMYTKGLQIMVG